MEAKGLKISIRKTKETVSGKNCADVGRRRKWLCAVCEKGVRSDSVQCTWWMGP